MSDESKILSNIKRQARFKGFLVCICMLVLICGFLSFFFYSFDGANKAIRLIANKESIKIQKIMMNPKIKFEHDDGNIFDINAKKAIHMDKNDIEMFGVVASGEIGQISAGNLLITNNGNNLHFSNNPILIIKEVKNEQ